MLDDDAEDVSDDRKAEKMHLDEEEYSSGILTNGGNDCGSKVESTGEFPLNACLMWHDSDDIVGDLIVVVVGDVVLSLEFFLFSEQFEFLLHLELRF